jgi:hypothetical protein
VLDRVRGLVALDVPGGEAKAAVRCQHTRVER